MNQNIGNLNVPNSKRKTIRLQQQKQRKEIVLNIVQVESNDEGRKNVEKNDMFEASITSLEIEKNNKASWHFDSGTTNQMEAKPTLWKEKRKPKFITFVEIEKVYEVLYVPSSPKVYFQQD